MSEVQIKVIQELIKEKIEGLEGLEETYLESRVGLPCLFFAAKKEILLQLLEDLENLDTY